MNAVLEAAVELQEFLVQQSLPFCFIDGIAVLRWGEPRTTQDVDVSLFVEFGDERRVIEAVVGRFVPRIENVVDFALESRVILVQSKHRIALDIALAQFDFEKAIIERGSAYKYTPDVELFTISAEDLTILKAFAGREQDILDVKQIINANTQLDREFVISELTKLVELKPDCPALDFVRSVFEQ